MNDTPKNAGPWGQHAPQREADMMLAIDEILQRFGFKGAIVVAYKRTARPTLCNYEIIKRGEFSVVDEVTSLEAIAKTRLEETPAPYRLMLAELVVNAVTRAIAAATPAEATVLNPTTVVVPIAKP